MDASQYLNTNSTAPRVVCRTCHGNEPSEVRYFAQPGVAVLARYRHTLELLRQPADSGYWTGALFGKSEALCIEIGRILPLQCAAMRS